MKTLSTIILLIFVLMPLAATSGPADTKTRFYNFDDLLIEGKVKKPQVLYTDARQKVEFDRLLKLKKDFLPKLADTKKDRSLR